MAERAVLKRLRHETPSLVRSVRSGAVGEKSRPTTRSVGEVGAPLGKTYRPNHPNRNEYRKLHIYNEVFCGARGCSSIASEQRGQRTAAQFLCVSPGPPQVPTASN